MTAKKTAPKKPDKDDDDKPAKDKAKPVRELPDDDKLAVVDIPANQPYPTKDD